MTNHRDLLACPLCEGHGEVRRSRVAEFFSDPDLNRKIDAWLAEPAREEQTAETVCVTTPDHRDFQKDVHSWNPQLPMWRRSPKE